MKNTFGTSVAVTIFGESHGAAVGAVVDGLAPGIKIDEDFIRTRLELRKPYGSISTPRREKDDFQIVSGVFEGKTTGTPVCILIPNTSQRQTDLLPDRATRTTPLTSNTMATRTTEAEDISQAE